MSMHIYTHDIIRVRNTIMFTPPLNIYWHSSISAGSSHPFKMLAEYPTKVYNYYNYYYMENNLKCGKITLRNYYSTKLCG